MKKLWTLLAVFSVTLAFAQTTIKGTVNDNNNQPIPGANVLIQEGEGVVTDFDGNFSFTTASALPFTIKVSSVGFETQEVQVTSADAALNIVLTEAQNELEEIIIAASRTPERIAESPVSVERLSLKDIQNATSPDFYTSLENLKGVDVNYSAIGFASVNTRGFASFANTRFLQLVDGMDNAAPGLNFAVGNLLGLNQLDVASLELLPGASSALYGANAFNGILFMRSKSPFDSPGVSAYAKTGINSSSNNGDNTYYDVAVRAAFKLSDKFAVKFNVSHYQGKEWAATDFRQYEDRGAGVADALTSRRNQTVFNGLNLYGDEVTLQALGEAALGVANLDVATFGGALIQRGLLPAALAPALPLAAGVNVSMPGYSEQQLYNGDATSTKVDASIHFKLSENTELSLVSKLGMGNSIYQGASRYILKDFSMQQHKLELRGKNFFVRGYTTSEDSGNAYDAVNTGIKLSQAFAEDWFGMYAGTYIGARAQGGTGDQAHAAAYAAANATLPAVGSAAFNTAFDTITSTPLYDGSKFTDNTSLTHFDANYNFGDAIGLAEFQIGGSYRTYNLNSEGSIFTDRESKIDFSEYGVYVQAQRNFGDHLKFTGSIRYDGAQNFDGNYSPRVSFVWTPDEARNHNFRLSFQTGFRYPTTQNQYIGLETPIGTLLGAAPDNFDRFRSTTRTVTAAMAPLFQLVPTINVFNTLSGVNVRDNSFTATSVQAFVAGGAANPTLLQKATVAEIKPEEVTAYEIGYRGKIGPFYVDASYYMNEYKNFISANNVITPHYGSVNLADTANHIPAGVLAATPVPASLAALGNGDFTIYSITANTSAEVKSSGFNVGLDTTIKGFDVGLSITHAEFEFDQSQDADFEAGFNTPENTYKLSLGKEDLFKNVGFGLNFRHIDSYLWEASFADGMVPERNLLDAQLTYNLNKLSVKVGGSNILGEEYNSGPGAGLIGSTYFVGLTFQP
ncbi:MAG: TonB-dependent receptor [Flavobacteriaceae bacterium]